MGGLENYDWDSLKLCTKDVYLKCGICLSEPFSYSAMNAVRTRRHSAVHDGLDMVYWHLWLQVGDCYSYLNTQAGWSCKDQDGKPRLWNHPCSYSTAKWFWHMLRIYAAIIQDPHCAQIIPAAWGAAFHIPRYKIEGGWIFCWNNSIFCKYTLNKLQWRWHYILVIDSFPWDAWGHQFGDTDIEPDGDWN